jgi:Amt family ammonium transporter
VAELTAKAAGSKVALDTVWVLITAFLVFWMNAGFALVESGMCRIKNAVNILSKNFIVFALSSLAFYVVGWGFMFGNGNSFMGLEGLWFIGGADNSPATGDAYMGVYSAIAWTGIPLYAKFFFQLVFAGTAATIVSGCVAERIKYISFILFSPADRSCLPHHGTLDLGRRLACELWLLGLRGIDRRSHRRRRGRIDRDPYAGTTRR